jgi:hypothetical protein
MDTASDLKSALGYAVLQSEAGSDKDAKDDNHDHGAALHAKTPKPNGR